MDGKSCDHTTDSVSNSPYHPDYGFTDKFRLSCVELAASIGVPAAAESLGVSESSIYRWRKDYANCA